MDINNIALVRATNVIPFDGVVHPISNVPYLTKNIGLEFSARLSDLLHKEGIIPPIDYSKISDENYYDEMVALSSKILKEYLPYVSDYNSMVLFSLNGICPDDAEHGFGNNTFSNKKCAIIEPLSKHLDQTISLVPTDTAIKGDVVLSSEAIILIEEQTLMNLSLEQKNMLAYLNVQPFNGPLKEAIESTLEKTGRYSKETLSLSASTGGIQESETSESLKNVIDTVVSNLGLFKKKYFDLITTIDSSTPKYDEVCDEYKKMVGVQDYMMTKFLDVLLEFVQAPIELKNDISHNLYNKIYMEKVMELIKNVGIQNYKMFVDNYNTKLEQDALNKELMTPEEIVSSQMDFESKKI